MTDKPCKDCVTEGVTTKRPAPYPGPRCKTHHLVVKRARRSKAHGNRVLSVYGITPEQYQEIYDAQGGVCFICRRATGATRKLSVDHDHLIADQECGHDPKSGCPQCVRGLLCRPCNDMLGHARDDGEVFLRAILYLANPPAREILNGQD